MCTLTALKSAALRGRGGDDALSIIGIGMRGRPKEEVEVAETAASYEAVREYKETAQKLQVVVWMGGITKRYTCLQCSFTRKGRGEWKIQ